VRKTGDFLCRLYHHFSLYGLLLFAGNSLGARVALGVAQGKPRFDNLNWGSIVAAGSKPVASAVAKPSPKPETLSGVAKHIIPEATPDFSKMTSAEKVAWQKARWDRILGK
jgi:hypothetical protein